MLPVVCVVGKSGTGKTRMMELLIAGLKRRGYKVAAAKHAREVEEMDRPGKDSWRLLQAGADTVVLSSPDKVVTTERPDKEPGLAELAARLKGDILLAEGFRSERMPKIEVHRAGFGELYSSPDELLAVVTDEPLDVPVTQYTPEDADKLVELIEREILSRRGRGT